MSHYYNTWDDNYEDWKIGDKIVDTDDVEGKRHYITHIDHTWERVSWVENGEACMTRCHNMLRVHDIVRMAV